MKNKSYKEDPTAFRTCVDCKVTKIILDFPQNQRSRGGYLPRCKRCYSNRNAMNNYGVVIDVGELGHCSICYEQLMPNQYAIDHDHSCCPGTGSCGKCVRGFLCDGCNIGLGHFRDSQDLLQKAINYLVFFEIFKTPAIGELHFEKVEIP